VLNVYINLPENSPAADHHNLLAESIGLYGMRMASTAQGEKASQGLTFIVEITAILTELCASKSLNLKEIRVSLLPDRPLPDSITIAIGRLSIFAMSAS
jgi:tyrosinase